MSGQVMIPKNSIKPLELVVSAIHCLREKKGSSPQNIIRYLVGKYNVNTEVLRPHVHAGLKRGISFGLITQDSGLYRLNDILSAPMNQLELGSGDSLKVKTRKKIKKAQKPRLRKNRPLRRRAAIKRCHRLQRCRRKPKTSKNKRQRTKNVRAADGARRNEVKRQRQKRQKNKHEADQSVTPEKVETEPAKAETAENQRPTVSTKEQEGGRLTKT